MILARNLDFHCIFFTDEFKIDLSSYTKDSIRLEPETKEKLKSGDLSVYNLINRQQKKFEYWSFQAVFLFMVLEN